MAFLLSLSAAVIAVLLMKTSVENKLSVLLIALFVAVLYGLKDSQTLYHVLQAARYGLLFLVGLWIVKSVFARRAFAATVMCAAPMAAALPTTPTTAAVVETAPSDSPPPPPPETTGNNPSSQA